MTFSEYQAINAIHWSVLKEMRRSPLHYRYRETHDREDTTSFAKGRAAHTAVFEPDRFLLDYALFEGERRQGAAWKDCVAANEGKTILKVDEYAICLAIRDAVRSHPVASKLLLCDGKNEQTIQWTDDVTGLACKGRIDRIAIGVLLDLKTTGDLEPRRFGGIAARLGYHNQKAFYAKGLRLAFGVTPAVKIIAVEAAAPHDVAVFDVDADTLYAGEEENTELLRRVVACRESKLWPGRFPEASPLSMPKWWYAADGEADLAIVAEG